jgi:hypothetical protein
MDTRVSRRATRVDQLSARQKSKVTNGTALLSFVDGRSTAMKRYRDLVSTIIADQGGADRCTEVRAQLVRRFAGCSILAEALEAKLANGGTINILEYTALTSAMVRVASRIGVNRLGKAVPTMDEFLKQRGHQPHGQTRHDNSDDDADEEGLVPSYAGDEE